MAIPSPESRRNPLQWLVVAVPYFWLLLFFAAPFFIIVKISLSDTAIAMPPYVPVFEGFSRIGEFFSQLDFDNYLFLTEDPLYIEAYLSSLRIAVISTLLLLLIGYPMALAMARAPSHIRPTLVMLVILPFWTSFLIRVYAWIGILKPEGLLTVLFQRWNSRPGRAGQHLPHRDFRLHRHRLFLSSLHGAAALFGSGETRQHASGSCRRSWLPALEGLLEKLPSPCRCRVSWQAR